MAKTARPAGETRPDSNRADSNRPDAVRPNAPPPQGSQPSSDYRSLGSMDPRNILAGVEATRKARAEESGLKAAESLREFVKQAWHIVEPAKAFIHGWHADAIADHLEAVSRGQIRNLLINICPGAAKSLLVSVLWPAWQWIEKDPVRFPVSGPKWRSLATSYSEALATRDSVRCRALLESPWYVDTFKRTWDWSSDQNIKTWFENTVKGSRISLGVGGSATGIRADAIVCDDPINAKDQYSDSVLDNCIFWWDQVMSSRLNDMAKGVKIIIMQRLSVRDLAARVLETGGYQHLNLPSEFEMDRRTRTFDMGGNLLWEDPRKEEGELLFPALFPREVIEQAKKDLGTSGYQSQHQQRPAPAEGGILKRHWWRYWMEEDAGWGPVRQRGADGEWVGVEAVALHGDRKDAGAWIPYMDEYAQTWDLAFKDLKGSDFVVGQVWGRKKSNKFLLHQVKGRFGITETIQKIREVSKDWPRAVLKLVEDKANGPAVVEMLRGELAGLIAVNPEGGKIGRAQAVAPQIESGNVFLPHPSAAPWVAAFIESAAAFPSGKFDDEIDAMSQMLRRWGAGIGSYGVLEYGRQELEMAEKKAIATGDRTERCEACGSVAVTWSPSAGFRCQCGAQWGAEKRLEMPKRPSGGMVVKAGRW